MFLAYWAWDISTSVDSGESLLYFSGLGGLIGTSFPLSTFWGMSQMIIPPPGYPPVEPPAISNVFLIVSIMLFWGHVVLWIWQIFDARRVCRAVNNGACAGYIGI